MIIGFESAGLQWWRKPLVRIRGKAMPAELAVLAREVSAGEEGAWLNSRGVMTGAVALEMGLVNGKLKFFTRRVSLPRFVSQKLTQLYEFAGVKKGCPDLVIWKQMGQRIRLVEVKCPLWDKPTVEQNHFLEAAANAGIDAKIVEWRPCYRVKKGDSVITDRLTKRQTRPLAGHAAELGAAAGQRKR